MSWNFTKALTTLRKGERFNVKLNIALKGGSCKSVNRSYVSVEGPRLEDHLVYLVPNRQALEERFVEAPPGVTSGSASASGTSTAASANQRVEVLADAPTNVIKTGFLRIYAYVPGHFHVIAYQFNSGP